MAHHAASCCGSEVFGPVLATGDGELSTTEAMVGKKYVGIYFSAHWCPPCRSFTPKLAEWFVANAADLNMEIVFASSDNDEQTFDKYFGEMPWKALPYARRDIQAELSKKYKVSGIPSLVIVDAESGDLCTANGRDGVSQGAAGLPSFPWNQHGASAGAAAQNKQARAAALLQQTTASEPEPKPDHFDSEPDHFEPEPDTDTDTDAQPTRGPWEILTLGEEVQLLQEPVALRAAFARFFDSKDGAGDNGGETDLSAEMETLAQDGLGVVVEVYEPDRSVTLRLVNSGELLECPFEAIARKTGEFDPGFDWARAKYTVGQFVQLVGDPEAFRGAFDRFEGSEDDNSWTEEKAEYRGAIGTVAATWDDKTLTLQFGEEVQVDFPFEVIDLDVTTNLELARADVTKFSCLPCGPAGRVLL